MSLTFADAQTRLHERFESLDFTLRGLEIDHDEDMRGATISRRTFSSMLDVLKGYVTIATTQGSLSENLQRKFHEAITETCIIVDRAPEPEFNVVGLLSDLDQSQMNDETFAQLTHLNVIAGVLTYAESAYEYFLENPEEFSNDRVVSLLRGIVLDVLMYLMILEDLFITIDMENTL